jgi:hypothetical protein
MPADVFTILTSPFPLSGQFENVASGQRLATMDGFGSFLVTYDGNSVVLSNFGPVPEPATFALLSSVAVLGALRRQKHQPAEATLG